MRLRILDRGHRLRARLFFATVRLSGSEMIDVVKTFLYRPGVFGRAILELSPGVMRGPSFWTAGEREYLAVATAELHRCPFCVTSHTEMVRLAARGEIDPADPASARPELTAVQSFLAAVTRTPDDLTAADLQPVRAAEVPDEAVIDALHVNLLWNVVNRVANAFDFQLRDGQLESGTKALHRMGYRMPGFLTSDGSPPPEAGPPKAMEPGRHGVHVARLRRDVFTSPGRTDPALRAAAGGAGGAAEPAEPWRSYAEKVRNQSFRVSDADVHDLIAAGHSEDEIFEVTVAAAVGASLHSLDAGMALAWGEDS